MNITVWGGAGFLGSHICDALTKIGHQVTIADLEHSIWATKNQKIISASVLDKKAVFESVKNADYVFNFSGIADIQEANIDPLKSAEVNIVGNLNLLDACVKQKVKRYFFASSLYVYSNSGGFYRCTKQACEVYIDEYSRQHDLNYTVLRFGSLYGSRTDEKNAIYRFIKESLTKKKISYFGSPDSLREYIHVEDAAQICCEIIDEKFKNQHLTITGQQSMRVKDLFCMIRDIVGDDIEFEYNTNSDSAHYKITPYAFSPKLGRKYSPELQIDLGQGLLQVIQLVHKEIHG